MKKIFLFIITFWFAYNSHVKAQCNANLTVASGAKDQTVCMGQSITAVTYLTNADNFNTSGLPGGVTADFTNGLISIYGTPDSVGTFNYSFTAGGDCGTDTTVNGTIIVNPRPTAFVTLIGRDNVCLGDTSQILISFTGTAPWSGTLQNNDPFTVFGNFPVIVTPPFNTNYRVVTLTDGTGCSSLPDDLNGNADVTVKPVPLAPLVNRPVIYCQGNIAAPLTAAGTDILWYTSSTGGDPGQAAPTPVTTNADTTFYYASQTVNGCESPRASIDVIVTATPVINPVSDTIFCNGSAVSNGIHFTLAPAGSNFSWSNNNINIGLPANGIGNIPPFIAFNSTTGADSATITVSAASPTGTCPALSRTFKITVLPGPSLTSGSSESTCSNAPFVYTATSSAANTDFSWTRNLPTGITGNDGSESGSTGVITDLLDNTTAQPDTVKYFISLSTGTGNGCLSNDIIKVIVHPKPVVNSLSNVVYCNGAFVSSGIPFSSASPDSAFTWTCNPSIGFGTSGSGSIPSFFAVNNGSDNVVANVAVMVKTGSDNCPAADSARFTITVRPGPALTSVRTGSICDNSAFNYTATSSTNESITAYSWERLPNVDITPAPGPIVNSGLISESLHNTTLQPVIVEYVFGLSIAGGCIAADTVKLTVNPTPVINAIDLPPPFCNGDNAAQIGFSSVSPASSFVWTCTPSIGFGTNGSGSIPSFVATNTGTSNIDAAVAVLVKAGNDNCPATDSARFIITVRPTPVLTSVKTASICDNAPFVYSATGNTDVTITNFNWTRLFNSNITPLPGPAVNSNQITETLHNTTQLPVIVEYLFGMSIADGCTTADTVKLTVNPTPAIDNGTIHRYSFCNGEVANPVNFTSQSPGASFSWTCDTTIGFGRSGNGNIPAFIATNNGSDSILATVKVKISAGSNSCNGDTATFTITVYPSPKLVSSKITSVCDTVPFRYTAASSVGYTNFSWTRVLPPAVTGEPSAISGTSAGIADKLDNLSSQPDTVKYLFSLSTAPGSCQGTDVLQLVVNPTPAINPLNNYIFCNGQHADSIVFGSTSPNASFAWVCDKSIGFGTGGIGKIPAFTAVNPGVVPIVANVKVSITASSDVCKGDSATFTITVNPSPPKPDFSWLNLTNGRFCTGSANINFNVIDQVSSIAYSWVAVPADAVSIRDTNNANTAISFFNPGTYSVKAIATNSANGGCTDAVSHDVIVEANADAITARKIVLKNPGNLLIYPDNSMDIGDGYQWGYDSVLQSLPDYSLSIPIPIQGQVYQFFTPQERFVVNNVIDTVTRAFWVLLHKGGCYTKVYYNGPYAARPVAVDPPEDNSVRLQLVPNHSNGIFDMVLKGNIYGTIRAAIYNATGQLVMQKDFVKTISQLNERFNAGHLPGGLYYLIINSSDLKKVTARFVIQH